MFDNFVEAFQFVRRCVTASGPKVRSEPKVHSGHCSFATLSLKASRKSISHVCIGIGMILPKLLSFKLKIMVFPGRFFF